MSAESDRASALFLALAEVPPSDRVAWLNAQCGDDLELRREIESMLGGFYAPDDFLDPDALHPPVVDADTPLTPGTRLGDFSIQRVIGAGSAGIVYVARQRYPQRTVALKVLRRGLAASSARRRFELEAELLGQLHHPGIAHIFAAHPGDEVTPPFMAMELVDGPPVTDYVTAKQLDVRARLELIAKICDAVQHAHQRGIIHRDLKPANVLVTGDGQPKVLDFGVARSSGAAVAITTISTEAGQLLGTVPFMSPEQIAALPEDIDTRTDIYALGVILFRVLTGHLPFAEDNPALPELARRIAQADPPRLGSIDAAFAGDLETIVATALAKEKERRYASAGDLAADLRRHLSGQPVAASAESAWYFVRRRVRRYRLAVGVSLAGFLALAALATYASVERMRAEDANVRLGDELATSNIERGRLLGRAGNLRAAEDVLWHELFRKPHSTHARWTLSEVYSHEPSLWTRTVDSGGVDIVKFDHDGLRLFAAGGDSRILVLDPLTGDPQQVLEGHTGVVTALALLPDTRHVVSAGRDGTLRVWRSDGRALTVLETRSPEIVGLAAAGPRSVVTAANDGRVRLFTLDPAVSAISLELPGLTVMRVAASMRHGLIAVGTAQGYVSVWDLAARRERWRSALHAGNVSALAFHTQQPILYSGGADQQVVVSEASTGQVKQRVAPANGTIRNLVVDRAGTRLAAAGWWRSLLWTVSEGRIADEHGVSEPSGSVDVSPDGRLLATCDGVVRRAQPLPRRVRMWDFGADARLTHWSSHRTRIVGLAATASDTVIVSAAADGSIRGQLAGMPSPRFTIAAGANPIGVALDKDGRRAFTIAEADHLVAWDTSTGNRLAEAAVAAPALEPRSRVSAFSVAPDSATVALGHADGSLTFWTLRGERFVPGQPAIPSDDGEVLAVAIHGNHLAVAHREGAVVLRNLNDGRPIVRLPYTTSPFALDFSADGRWLAVGTWVGSVDLWNVHTKQKARTFDGHSRLASGLDFSTDGALVVTASRDGTVRLWETLTGRSLATLAARDVGASRVQLLSDDRLLVGYDDGEVEIRDLGYYFRHVAGQAEFQLQYQQQIHGVSYPRAADALDWARRVLTASRGLN